MFKHLLATDQNFSFPLFPYFSSENKSRKVFLLENLIFSISVRVNLIITTRPIRSAFLLQFQSVTIIEFLQF